MLGEGCAQYGNGEVYLFLRVGRNHYICLVNGSDVVTARYLELATK
jgi:hypothetical protein